MAKKENCEQLQEEKSLEEMFAELDLLAEKLENRDTSLEDSFILYRQGMELLKLCSGKLDTGSIFLRKRAFPELWLRL